MRVSVVVTTYNQARYIAAAVESALAQTHPPCEVIVIDDGSTDETAARVAPFGDRVSYVRQQNQGVAAARNAGVARARGDAVAFLDGDDVWERAKLAVQVAHAERRPRAGLVVVDGIEFTDDRVLRSSLFPPWCTWLQELPDGAVASGRYYRQFLDGNLVSSTTQAMVPLHVLESVGPSDTRLRLSSDYDLYLRIAARHEVTFVKERLARWRYHADSASGLDMLRVLRYTPDDVLLLRKQLHDGPLDLRGEVARQLRGRAIRAAGAAYQHGRAGHQRWALRYLLRLWARAPTCAALPLFATALCLPHPVARRLRRSILGDRAGGGPLAV